jgi:hypothetical protein
MNTHEFTVYPYHCAFFKDFPELKAWLAINGFSILHSHNDFRTQLIHTFWDDHTAASEKNGTYDAENSLMITYCQLCKTVTVYHREIVADAHNEKALVKELDRRVFGKPGRNTEEIVEEPIEFQSPDEINNWIGDEERQ